AARRKRASTLKWWSVPSDIGGVSCSDKALDGFDVADDDRALAENDEALAMPVLENLVHALPAATRHVAELALRDVQFDRRAVKRTQTDPLDELQQCFGDSRLEMQEHHVLDLLCRLPQPMAKDSEKDHAEIGMILEDRQKIPAVQNQEF